MNEKARELIEDYYRLRDEIDAAAQALEQQHKEHMTCKKGCDLCCMALDVFPIEYYAIQNESGEIIENLETEIPKNDEACYFLKDHTCTVYRSRPIICRTHGLPLLYMNREGTQWELSTCELNFTDFDDFDDENTYPQDTFNSKLFMLNQQFVKHFKEGQYSDFDRIPMKNLLDK